MGYEKDDYLLIRDDKVIAVSGNSDFEDDDCEIENWSDDDVYVDGGMANNHECGCPIVMKDTDTIVVVVENN